MITNSRVISENVLGALPMGGSMTEATVQQPAPMKEIEPAPYISAMTQIATYAEIDEILRSKDFVQGSHQESMPFFGDCLLLLDGSEHFERRRLEAPLFAKQELFHYEREVVQPAIDRVLAACRDDVDTEGLPRGDLVSMTKHMLLQMTAEVTGIDGVDTEQSTNRFGDYLGKLGEGATVEWSARDHDEVIAEVLDVRDEFVLDFFRPSMDRRREMLVALEEGRIAESELPRDLLMLLVRNHAPDWDPELPLREATLYLVAGFQTTTHAIPHVVNHLAGWIQAHPEDAPRLRDQAFLQAATYESLRLHLPAPSLLRIATKPVTLASTGREIAAGERVALLFTPANRDVSAFGDDAAQFDPRRAVTAPMKPWGLAFGGGVHTCIGRQLVTGLSRTVDDVDQKDRTTDGIGVQILASLYEAGVELDPHQRPAYREVSHHDAFETFPVRFRNL
jgi:cytochrome P450